MECVCPVMVWPPVQGTFPIFAQCELNIGKEYEDIVKIIHHKKDNIKDNVWMELL